MEELKRKMISFADSEISDALDRIQVEYKDYNLEYESKEEKAEIVMQVILDSVKHSLKLNINRFIENLEEE